jgi:hypothetical protein
VNERPHVRVAPAFFDRLDRFLRPERKSRAVVELVELEVDLGSLIEARSITSPASVSAARRVRVVRAVRPMAAANSAVVRPLVRGVGSYERHRVLGCRST